MKMKMKMKKKIMLKNLTFKMIWTYRMTKTVMKLEKLKMT